MSLALVQDGRQPESGGEGRAGPLWSVDQLRGSLTELSQDGLHGATLVFASLLLAEAQRHGDYVSWISARREPVYGPDLRAWGLDLGSLVWVQTDSDAQSARSAERLLQSGGFGLVVIDCQSRDVGEQQIPMALQGRLIKLAQMHAAGVLFLSDKPESVPSVSSMIGVRAVAGWSRRTGMQVECHVRAIKDKRHGPGWCYDLPCQIPEGWSPCDAWPV